MTTEQFVSRFAAEFDDSQATAQPWLQNLKRAAFDSFKQQGLPTRRQEQWKYTRIERFAVEDYRLAKAPLALSDTLATDSLPDALALVFIDGRLAAHLSTLNELPEGVQIVELATAAKEEATQLATAIAQYADYQSNVFTALNTAFLHDGLAIRLAAGVKLTQPLHLIYLHSGQQANWIAHPRIFLELFDGAELTLLEQYTPSQQSHCFINGVTEVSLGANAILNFSQQQAVGDDSLLINRLEVEQARDSQFHYFNLCLGGKLVRQEVSVTLAGTGAHAQLDGFYHLNGSQQMDLQTRVLHAVDHTTSAEHFRGIADDQATAVFNGQIKVLPKAQKIHAQLLNKNLLLSPQAEINTKPELEIYADDVQCSHGATIGDLDATALFYLQSRGLSVAAAKTLLLYAFAKQQFAAVSHASISQQLQRACMQKIDPTTHLEHIS